MDEQPEILKRLDAKAKQLKDAAFKVKAPPMSEFGTPYASFHRRLLAATIDTLIVSLTIVPLSHLLTTIMIGQVDVDITPLILSLQGVADPVERTQAIQHFLYSDRRLDFLSTYMTLQLTGLMLFCMACWKYWAATPGKMLLRIQVVDEKTGKNLDYIQGFWRLVSLAFSISFFCLGIFWISISKRRQGWHDIFVASVVIIKPKKNAQSTSADAEEVEV